MAITQKSRWDDYGQEPPAGEAKYTAGEQPIAEYDNWFNKAVVDDIAALNQWLDNLGITKVYIDTEANKPASGATTELFIATDTNKIYRGTGSGWQEIPVLSWENITNKPTAFPPEAHNHTISEITDLANASVDYANTAGDADTVDGKHASDFAAAGHTHTALGIDWSILEGSPDEIATEVNNTPYVQAAAAILNMLDVDTLLNVIESANLTASRIAAIIQSGAIEYTKLLTIFKYTTRFNEIIDALTFDYIAADLASFTAVLNSGAGTASISGNTFTLTDTGTSLGHCYYKPAIVKRGCMVIISANVTIDVGNAYGWCGLGFIVKTYNNRTRTIALGNYGPASEVGCFGYNGVPESVTSITYYMSDLPNSGGTVTYRGAFAFPEMISELYAVFLGARTYNCSRSVTLEAGGFKVLIIPTYGGGNEIERLIKTVV